MTPVVQHEVVDPLGPFVVGDEPREADYFRTQFRPVCLRWLHRTQWSVPADQFRILLDVEAHVFQFFGVLVVQVGQLQHQAVVMATLGGGKIVN